MSVIAMVPLVLAWSFAAILSGAPAELGSSPTPTSAKELATGISQHDVDQAVASYKGPIQDCYEGALDKDPKARGRVVVSFEVDEQGHVTSAKSTAGTTLADKTAVACIVEVFGKLDFDEQSNPVTLRYSLALEPPKDDPPPKP